MISPSLPRHDVVLLGAGHTHAHILRSFRMHPLPDTRLTCVSNFAEATYSGMLPGVLAGQYAPHEMTIDLVRLCASGGVRLVVAEVTGVDRAARQLHFADRAPLRYDWLSVGIGSRPTFDGVEVMGDGCLSIKPMQTFLARLTRRCEQLRAKAIERVRVVIVGAGAGGVEIASCLPRFLSQAIPDATYEVTLVQAHPQVLGEAWRGTQRRVARELRLRGIQFVPSRRVTRVDEQEVRLDDGSCLPADIVLWSTSAVAPPLLASLGLATDARGFLLTRPTLQAVEDEHVFAVGDSGTLAESPTPKAGVYAVRQGPVLWENLQRALRGEPLRPYRPQTDFLKLINLGDNRAIGEWRGWSFGGRWAWRWKDSIDTRFMRMFQEFDLSAMGKTADTTRPTESAPTLRCVGCGGKVGGTVLGRVLRRLEIGRRPEVNFGLEPPDDAAVLTIPAPGRIAVTSDFFATPWDDPYFWGRVAALHSASDCFAMGATPIAALAIATLPPGLARQQEQTLYEMLAGACREFRSMGTVLAGGHTLENATVMLGFTVIAEQSVAPTLKGALQPGDALILTRPLGTGVLLAAHMRAQCRAPWWQALVDHLLTSNQPAAMVALRHDVRAMTDVTGFGLAGHLGEMLRGSQVSAELELSTIPLLPGVAELLDAGLESTLAPENRGMEVVAPVDDAVAGLARYRVLFDPQTQGGLLIGCPAAKASIVLEELTALGIAATRIGTVCPLGDGGPMAKIGT